MFFRYIYAIGGQDGIQCLNQVERYDPKENRWTKVAPMNTRRLGVAVAVLGGYIYAIGTRKCLKQPSFAHVFLTLVTCIYQMTHMRIILLCNFVGGSDGVSPLNTVERYDPRQNKWVAVRRTLFFLNFE